MNTNQIKLLVDKINKAKETYYNQAISLITDKEYDDLIDELTLLDPENPILSKPGIKPDQQSGWTKTKHNYQMVSLNKVNTTGEFVDWHSDFGNEMLIGQYKYDGSSIELQYDDGILTKAITRGDGEIGEDIYKNALCIPSIMILLSEKVTCSISGEIYLTHTNFNKINEILLSRGKKQHANPRNAASGISRSYDNEFCKYLTFVPYNTNLPIQTEDESIQKIKQLGYTIDVILFDSKNIDVIMAQFKIYENEIRATLDFDIDGLVIKVNDKKRQFDAGTLNGNPKAQIAWKFKALSKPTKVIDIEWSPGRNGRITPVAILEPVNLGGVVVSRVSLHNMNIWRSLVLSKGDEVKISRRNDVIPYLEGVINRLDNKEFITPSKCPVCNQPIKINGDFLECTNSACKSRDLGTIMKWLDINGILNIGESTVEKLYSIGLVTSPVDLYTITVDDLTPIIGQTMAEKIKKNIISKTPIKLAKFVKGFNIDNFGESTASLLINAGFNTIDKICNIKREDLLKIGGIQDKTADKILNGLASKVQLIKELIKLNILEQPNQGGIMSNISGKSFCFTGGLSRIGDDGKPITRKQAWSLIEAKGGSICKSVSKGLTYLVQADPTSTSLKTQAAIKNGTKILGEDNFWKMME